MRTLVPGTELPASVQLSQGIVIHLEETQVLATKPTRFGLRAAIVLTNAVRGPKRQGCDFLEIGAVEQDHKANSFDLTLTEQRVTPIHADASSHACPEEPNLVDLIPALRAFARSLCGHLEEADDLVEETMVKGIAASGEVKRFGLKPWILGLMRKTLLARQGKAAAKDERPSGCLSQASAAQSPGSMQTGLNIARAMDRLPEPQRHAIVLVCMIGLLHEEAAEICGCDTATIKRRLHKPKSRLAALAGPVSRPDRSRRSESI